MDGWYSGKLTKNEEQLYFLLQVIANNQKCYLQASKRALIGSTTCYIGFNDLLTSGYNE